MRLRFFVPRLCPPRGLRNVVCAARRGAGRAVQIIQVADIPYTVNMKRVEVPVKKVSKSPLLSPIFFAAHPTATESAARRGPRSTSTFTSGLRAAATAATAGLGMPRHGSHPRSQLGKC